MSKNSSLPPASSSLLEALQAACSDGDVVLHCSDGTHRAHSSLLSLHSPVLKDKLSRPVGSTGLERSSPGPNAQCNTLQPHANCTNSVLELKVPEPHSSWALVLGAIYLSSMEPNLFTLENAYKMVPVAHRYSMQRVLQMVGDLVVCALFDDWNRVRMHLAVPATCLDPLSWTESILFDKSYNHPYHALSLLNLAHMTGHRKACELVQSVLKRYRNVVNKVFSEEPDSINENVAQLGLLQSTWMALVPACLGVEDASIKCYSGTTSNLPARTLSHTPPPVDMRQAGAMKLTDISVSLVDNSGRRQTEEMNQSEPPGESAAAINPQLQTMLSTGNLQLHCKRDDKRVQVHSAMLCLHSAVLRDMLQGADSSMTGGTSQTLQDLAVDDDSASWLALLSVLYPLPDDGGCAAHMVPAVMRLADKYDMGVLSKRIVHHSLVRHNFYALIEHSNMTIAKLGAALALLAACSKYIENSASKSPASTNIITQPWDMLLQYRAEMLVNFIIQQPEMIPELSPRIWWKVVKYVAGRCRK